MDKAKSVLTPEQAAELLKGAMEARDHAYTPYSHFHVGAALLTKREKFTRVATLRTRLTVPVSARSGPHFSRQSMKESGILRPSLSWAARKLSKARTATSVPPAASAARS